MTALQMISIALGIGATLAGAIIGLVRLGYKVGVISYKMNILEVDNKNNKEKIEVMTESSNEQNTSIKLLEQKLDTMSDDIKDVKDTLNVITEYVKDSEANRAKIESRLDNLEKASNNG